VGAEPVEFDHHGAVRSRTPAEAIKAVLGSFLRGYFLFDMSFSASIDSLQLDEAVHLNNPCGGGGHKEN
jgi:hypothetical protein